MSKMDMVIRWCENIADDNNYQYSQASNLRWGTYSKSTPPYYYDCSSFVTTALSLFLGYDYTQNHTAWTGTMYNNLKQHGFIDVTSAGIIQRGDIMLNHNDAHRHTAIYTGTIPANNIQGVSKISVAAQSQSLGINKNISDTNHYDYILRYPDQIVWHAKNTHGYARESAEALDNAYAIYSTLAGKGWTLNAVCGLLGNMEHESEYNPWRWQNDNVLRSTDDYRTQNRHAYGLVQFDPASKYIDNASSYTGYNPKFADTTGSPNDGQAQMLYLNDHADYYYTAAYPETYAQYKVSTQPVAYLTRAWFHNYERGTWSDRRIEAANYWYEKLQGYAPATDTPFWLLKKLKDNMTKI